MHKKNSCTETPKYSQPDLEGIPEAGQSIASTAESSDDEGDHDVTTPNGKLNSSDAPPKLSCPDLSVKIDEISRILFPFAFVIFNVFYWCTFML